ncbi:MAG: hypothetical protein LBF16_00075 [Pseudomonadales bacterium]|jgi:hypothetical protein|nr:hypothetical protein [Pseudomonadales bacterium]
MSLRTKIFIALLVVVTCNSASASYDANMSGEIEGFYVYAEGDYVFFRLKNQPGSHFGCDPTYFVIPETVSADRRKALLARLSLAYAMQEVVNIGYAANGDCAAGYIRVYRVG